MGAAGRARPSMQESDQDTGVSVSAHMKNAQNLASVTTSALGPIIQWLTRQCRALCEVTTWTEEAECPFLSHPKHALQHYIP